MDILRNFWNWLDGKKTTIGVLIHFLAYGLQGIKVIDDSTFNSLIMTGDTVMAVGLGFKGWKLRSNY